MTLYSGVIAPSSRACRGCKQSGYANDSIHSEWAALESNADIVRYQQGELLLTDAELSLYNGTDPSLPIYLALNGTIYDVSAGPKHYGPGGSYHFFAGKDATRAFVTGCFDTDLVGDLRGVEEMFMPLDLDEAPTFEEGVDEEEKKRKRGEWKSKREQARRKAKARVREIVEQWRETYDKGKGGKYFKVGRVNRPNGYEGEPKLELCNKAKLSRPKTST
jgi:predicted heme/steroid binding protein